MTPLRDSRFALLSNVLRQRSTAERMMFERTAERGQVGAGAQFAARRTRPGGAAAVCRDLSRRETGAEGLGAVPSNVRLPSEQGEG